MKQKHIVVVDGLWAGHHAVYAKTFARILLEAGYKVSVFCPAPEEVAEAVDGVEVHAFSDLNHTSSGLMPKKIALILAVLAHWLHISKALKMAFSSGNKPDMVFFAWLDSYLYSRFIPAWLVDRIFRFAWSGLYFHPRHHRIEQHGVVRGVLPDPERLVTKSRMACSLAILDAGVMHKLQAKLGRKKVYVLPDFTDETPPCEDFQLVDDIKQKAAGRKIIGLLGGLSHRKGIISLMEISQQPAAEDWCFVFVGRLIEQTFSDQELRKIRQFFEEPKTNCFVCFDKVLDDAQFNSLVNVCDVIYAVYEDFPHSSNLVTKAASYGKSILVSRGGYMEEAVRQYNLGEAVTEGDIQAAIASLSRLTAMGLTSEYAKGMHEYSMNQSQDKLRQALIALVEDCVGSVTAGDVTNSGICQSK